jgi:predicted nucleic acid-binding protein
MSCLRNGRPWDEVHAGYEHLYLSHQAPSPGGETTIRHPLCGRGGGVQRGDCRALVWLAQSTKKKHNEAALEDFLKYVIVLDWPLKAAPEYGRIRAHLKKKGTPIGAMDLLIAAHAMVLDAVLVTDNISEFGRVPRLKVENWVNR